MVTVVRKGTAFFLFPRKIKGLALVHQLHLSGIVSFHSVVTLVFLLVTPALSQVTGSLVSSAQSADSTPAASGSASGATAFHLEDALALARKNNPQLRAAAAVSAGARAAIQSARAYTNPQFDFQMGDQSARKVANPGTPGLLQHYGAQQVIEIPRERRTRIEAARVGAKSSNYAEAGILLAVQSDVKHAFYEVLRRKEEIRYARENLALVEDLRRRIEVQVQVGEAGRLELTRAEAEIAKARTLVKNAQIELVAATAGLRAAVGVPPDMQIDPQGQLDPPITLPSLDSLRDQVLANHPYLAQAQANTERAQFQLENQKALRIPQPALSGEYEHQPDLTYYRMGVNVAIPLWNRRKGPIEEAKASLNVAKAETDQRRLELTASLERSYGQYELAHQQVVVFESASLKQADAALKAAQAAYKFGERGIMEVLDAQRVLQSVRVDLLDAQYQREFALIDLEQLGAITIGSK